MAKTKVSLWSRLLFTRFAGVIERKNVLRINMMLGRVAANFSNMENFGCISLLHLFNNEAIVFGRNFWSDSSHLCFHDDSLMSVTSSLGRSFPYISKTLRQNVKTWRVLTQVFSLLTDLSMKRIANSRL